jgi:hypothetical protein
MQEAEAKMINFVTEMKIIPAEMSMEETNKNTTLKQRKNTVVKGKKIDHIIITPKHPEEEKVLQKEKQG